MSDEPPEIPPVPRVKAPLFPDGHLFSEELLTQWVAIPSTEPLFLGPLTKGDFDHILFSGTNFAAAIAELRQAVIELSHGRVEHANVCLQNSTNRTIDAETRNRLFFEAIMKSAIEARKNAGK